MKGSPKGPLADSIERYLAHMHSLGKQLTKVGAMLQLLDGYLLSRGVPNERQIASADIEAFIASRPRPSPRSYNGREKETFSCSRPRRLGSTGCGVECVAASALAGY